MPSCVAQGQQRGLWAKLRDMGQDCPLFPGYKPVVMTMEDPLMSLGTKIGQIAVHYRALADLAFNVLADPLREPRHRAGCRIS